MVLKKWLFFWKWGEYKRREEEWKALKRRLKVETSNIRYLFIAAFFLIISGILVELFLPFFLQERGFDIFEMLDDVKLKESDKLNLINLNIITKTVADPKDFVYIAGETFGTKSYFCEVEKEEMDEGINTASRGIFIMLKESGREVKNMSLLTMAYVIYVFAIF